MADRKAVVHRRKRVQDLLDDDYSVSEIVEKVGVSERTVRRDIAAERSSSTPADPRPSRPSTVPPDLVVEAYVNYTTRFGREPRTPDWKSTNSWHHGADETTRYHEGWVSWTDREHRAWPNPSRDTQPGGWPALQEAARRRLREMEEAGISYTPHPVPFHARSHAFWLSHVRRGLRKGDPQVPDLVLQGFGDQEVPGVLQTYRGPVYVPLEQMDGHAIVGCGPEKSAVLDAYAYIEQMRGVLSVFVLPPGPTDQRRELLRHLAKVASGLPVPVALLVDDAEDVLDSLFTFALARRQGDIPNLHLAIAWNFRDSDLHRTMYLTLRSRTVGRQTDNALLAWLAEHHESEMPDWLLPGVIMPDNDSGRDGSA